MSFLAEIYNRFQRTASNQTEARQSNRSAVEVESLEPMLLLSASCMKVAQVACGGDDLLADDGEADCQKSNAADLFVAAERECAPNPCGGVSEWFAPFQARSQCGFGPSLKLDWGWRLDVSCGGGERTTQGCADGMTGFYEINQRACGFGLVFASCDNQGANTGHAGNFGLDSYCHTSKPCGQHGHHGSFDYGNTDHQSLRGNDDSRGEWRGYGFGSRPEFDPNGDVRSINGSGNNLQDGSLGQAGTEEIRLSGIGYEGNGDQLAGGDRPGPREISNTVNSQVELIDNKLGMSDFIWAWGQFIDHDISETPIALGEQAPIAVPIGDPYFDPFGTGDAEINFERSSFHYDENGIRQFENKITAFIDGSHIYGSDQERADFLREYTGGRMAMSEGGFLPFESASSPHGDIEQFAAGDDRANENVVLSSLHTIFVREHNRLAEEIAAQDYACADLSDPEVDEAIYQEARRIVGAQMQAITYNEFLPAILGKDYAEDYQGYDPYVDPTVSLEFSTAALRLGHSLLSPTILRIDADGKTIDEGNLALRDAFFNPEALLETGLDPILRGLATQRAQELDPYVIDDVRNFLFGPPGAGGFDLPALNIQRGRDHGLPSYNDVRESLGLDRVTEFNQVSSDTEIVARLSQAYQSVDQIDLWVGGLAEDHVGGGAIGETFRAIVVDQFIRLRDGDRFWYENVFSPWETQQIESVTLADIIERNTGVNYLASNVFIVGADAPTYA